MADLTRLLHPKSIAVFGSVWAENVVEQCDKIGFSGAIWPVHPKREKIAGRRCFRSVDELPEAPDAAFIGVNRSATLEVIADLSRIGCGGAVSFASGFSESGEADLQAAFVEKAGNMPVLGPNCYGVINCLDGAVIWPDQHGCKRVERGVAILTQSSSIGITLSMQRRGLPIAYIACVGNAAQTSLDEIADALISDPRVSALGVFMEGVGDPIAFADVVRRARSAGKGVVVLKAGQTERGQDMAMTHTASLTGGGVASAAFLARIGAGEVRSIPQLCEALKILHVRGPLGSRSFISVSCSGGEAGLVADACEPTALDFPPVPQVYAKRLSDALGPRVTVSNPLDYHTYIWGDEPRMTDVFTTALDGFDNAIFVIDPPRSDTCDPESFEPAFRAIASATRATGKPAFAVATLPETMEEDRADALMSLGVVPLVGIQDALAALEAASVSLPPLWQPWTAAPDAESDVLDEAEGKVLLRSAGIAVPAYVTALTIEELDPKDLTPPFALKGLGFAHKSEAGAVRLGVRDLQSEAPMAGADSYLLEEMVAGSVAELLIGLRRDPVYGATLTVGLGGVTTELLADTVTLVLPVTAEEVDAAFKRLRLWSLLDGYRGRPKADMRAVVDVVMRLQSMMAQEADLTEIEVNPLMVLEQGAVAADALVRRRRDV